MENASNISREEEVLRIFNMLQPKPKELLLSSRRYVRGGPIQTYNVKQRKKKPRVIFLFNDVLMIAKREGKGKYWLKTYMRLRKELQIEDMQTKLVPNVEFRIVAPSKTFIFFAETPEKKKEWLDTIRDCMDGKYDPGKEIIEVEKELPIPMPAIAPPVQPQVIVEEKVITETKEVFKFETFDVKDLVGDDDDDDDFDGGISIESAAAAFDEANARAKARAQKASSFASTASTDDEIRSEIDKLKISKQVQTEHSEEASEDASEGEGDGEEYAVL